MDFQEKLDAVVTIWQSGEVDDEWVFQSLREDAVANLSPPEAFSEIATTLAKLRQYSGESVATEIVETVLALAKQAQTTEVPEELERGQENLRAQFSDYGEYANSKLEEVFAYYRL